MQTEDRQFVQKLLFWDYVEESVQLSRAQKRVISVLSLFIEDMKEHERLENYEMCKLYLDVLEVFKNEFSDIG